MYNITYFLTIKREDCDERWYNLAIVIIYDFIIKKWPSKNQTKSGRIYAN